MRGARTYDNRRRKPGREDLSLIHILEAMEPIKIDQVVIGSCTNGRMEDMRRAAKILKGHKVHPDVRVIVIPGTQAIYKECLKEGIAEIFVDAGCAFSTPSCGPCMGGHMGVLAAGEKCVSTTNRNFVGRMGHVDSLIYLASVSYTHLDVYKRQEIRGV